MKTIKRILVLIAVIICCSCEKESHWLFHTYAGSYETTGIKLEFSDDRTECEVTERDVAEYPYGITHKTYRAYLNEEEKSFMLNEGDYDSRVIYRGKVTGFDQVTLIWYENDREVSIMLLALRDE